MNLKKPPQHEIRLPMQQKQPAPAAVQPAQKPAPHAQPMQHAHSSAQHTHPAQHIHTAQQAHSVLHEHVTPHAQPVQKAPPQQEPQQQPSGFQFLEQWDAANSYARVRTRNWYAAFIFITGALATYAIVVKDWLFLVFIAIGAGFVFLKGYMQPKIFHYGITQQGIVVNSRLYPFNLLETFWIHQPLHGYHELVLLSKKTTMTELRIPLGEKNPEKIHDIVIQHLAIEEDPEESFADILHRVVGI